MIASWSASSTGVGVSGISGRTNRYRGNGVRAVGPDVASAGGGATPSCNHAPPTSGGSGAALSALAEQLLLVPVARM
jgi:hypothetical protein